MENKCNSVIRKMENNSNNRSSHGKETANNMKHVKPSHTLFFCDGQNNSPYHHQNDMSLKF